VWAGEKYRGAKGAWFVRVPLLLALAYVPCAVGCGESHAPAMASSAAKTSLPSDVAGTGGEKEKAGPEGTATKSDDAPAPAAAGVSPKTEVRPAATADITFDDIKFDIQPDEPFERSMLTKKIENLSGKPVRIRGYILPSFQQTGLTQFVLVRDNLSCCFGPGAALYDCVVVEMQPGKSTDFNLYPVAVEGTFKVQEFNDPDGNTMAIYHLDGESVR
jgi:hypothetical protein